MARIKYDDVQAALAKDGWTLQAQTYVNLETEMEMLCPEKHTNYMSYGQWRRSHICPVCSANPYKDQSTTAVRKPAGVKRVLAIDQATSVSGWCIFDDDKLVKFGKIDMGKKDTSIRIAHCREWLINMIVKWRPDHIAIEDIQLQQIGKGYENVQTFKVLAQLQGVLINTCIEQAIDYSIVHVETWRSYCQIRGKYRADKKKSAQLRVKEWYDISVTQDEADAIGIGKYVAEKYMKSSVMINWE